MSRPVSTSRPVVYRCIRVYCTTCCTCRNSAPVRPRVDISLIRSRRNRSSCGCLVACCSTFRVEHLGFSGKSSLTLLTRSMSARSHDPEAGSAASSDDTRVEAGDAQAASPGEKSKAERADDGSPGSRKEGDDRFLVDFDGPDDPERPINRSRPQAWLIILAICFASAMVTCTSSMVAATYEGVEVQFGVSLEVATLGLSLCVRWPVARQLTSPALSLDSDCRHWCSARFRSDWGGGTRCRMS